MCFGCLGLCKVVVFCYLYSDLCVTGEGKYLEVWN